MSKLLGRAVGWLLSGGGDKGSSRGKRSRQEYEEEEPDDQCVVWADDHLPFSCRRDASEAPPQQQQQQQQQEQIDDYMGSDLASPASSAPQSVTFVDVDLANSTRSSSRGSSSSSSDQQGESGSPPPPAYKSLLFDPNILGGSMTTHCFGVPLHKKPRHTQTQTQENDPHRVVVTATKPPDPYMDFWGDIFNLPATLPLRQPPPQKQEEEEEKEEEEEEEQQEDKQEEEHDDDQGTEEDTEASSRCDSHSSKVADAADSDQHELGTTNNNDVRSTTFSPLFPRSAAKQAPDGGKSLDLMSSPPLAFGGIYSASSSPSSVVYTFQADLAIRSLVAPEALGFDAHGQPKPAKEEEEEEEADALFGRPIPPPVQPREWPNAGHLWERVEPLMDCKIEVAEEGTCVGAGPDLQTGVPSLFNLASETYWAMEEITTVILYRSLECMEGKSVLLLAKHASQRPPWAPQRLEVVAMAVDTQAYEGNGRSMLSLLAPAHARGPAKGGMLESKLVVVEGREELAKRVELPDLLALLVGHGSRWGVGCSQRHGGQQHQKRKYE